MKLDLSKFSFTAEQIRDINNLLYDDVLQAPEIGLITTLYPGIVFDREVGFIGEGGLVGVKNSGCKPVAQQWNIGTRKVVWEPRSWEILIDECWTDLEQHASVYSVKTGVEMSDFQDTDYYAIVTSVLARDVKKFIVRLVWFSDEDAKNVSDSGYITNGNNVAYFNILNGLWKQLGIDATANGDRLITVTENAAATYAAQELKPEKAAEYLRLLKYKAPMLLRSKEDAIVPCTQSFYDAWEQFNQGKELESLYVNLIDGRKVLKAYGMTLVPMPIWDEMIARYENTGVKLHNPHRALYTTKDNLAVGVDGTDSFDKMRTWYENKDRMVYIELMGKADAKVLNPGMYQLAI